MSMASRSKKHRIRLILERPAIYERYVRRATERARKRRARLRQEREPSWTWSDYTEAVAEIDGVEVEVRKLPTKEPRRITARPKSGKPTYFSRG